MSILTATIAEVKIGSILIEGLMDEKGRYYVAVPQMLNLNLIPRNRSLKQLEALLGKRFPTHVKLKTKLHSSQELRDTHEAVDLNKLEHAENFATMLIDKQDKEPLAAMKEAIAFYFD